MRSGGPRSPARIAPMDRVSGAPRDSFRAQHEAIREEFGRQAESWGGDPIDADLLWAAGKIGVAPDSSILDVAAGTGLLARALAPRARSVVAIDLTPEMLAHGRLGAERDGIVNVRFEEGAAERLPCPAGALTPS